MYTFFEQCVFFYYLAVINVITFFIFGIDKYLAIAGRSRVAEKYLWWLSIFGGSIGAFLGMEIFHHKRKKMNFYLIILLIFLAQSVLVYFLLIEYVF